MRTIGGRRSAIHAVLATLSCALALSGVVPAVATPEPAPSAGASAPMLEGWIEGIVGTPVVGGQIVVGGWAGDRAKGTPVAKVEVLLDGKPEAVATTNIPRADVAKVVGRLDYAQSGWNAVLHLDEVEAGPHTVSAVAYDAAGNRKALEGAKTIQVAAKAAAGAPAAAAPKP
jgi:hypothetical protein